MTIRYEYVLKLKKSLGYGLGRPPMYGARYEGFTETITKYGFQ